MSILLSEAIRNARLDVVDSIIGPSGIVKILAGDVPASTTIADTGTVLATLQLENQWMLAATGGIKANTGVWADSSADATGTATYFRLYALDGTTCGMQGSVGVSGADMIVLTTSFIATQPFTITSFILTDGN